MDSPLSPHFHVGIVVPDLASAMERMTEEVGVRWGPVLDVATSELRDGQGADHVLRVRICYSVDEPHLELIEAVPGSVWECNEHSNLHHLGFWSTDLAGESDRLSGSGCPLQLCGRAGADAPVQFAYHGSRLGVRVEVVDASLRPFMEQAMFSPPSG